MRLIDADELAEELSERVWYEREDEKQAVRIVKEFPTVDAVPVVRCKDCIHREPTRGKLKNELPYFCAIHREKFCDLEEFCSYGKQEVQDDRH